MAHLIESDIPKENKTFNLFKFRLPNLTGKFGISLCFGTKEIFLGLAVADIEVQTVVQREKKKVLVQKGSVEFRSV